MLRTDTLLNLLDDAIGEGFLTIGQIAIAPVTSGFVLRHVDDTGSDDLETFSPADAAQIARYDDSGVYRPLKTAPNLRHGWKIELSSLTELQVTLDALYPAALGNWRALLRKELDPVPLRSTLNRQTGMYRITGKLTDDQGSGLVETLCRPGCLRRILWPVSDQDACPTVTLPEKQIPLLCGEACNLFVAAARKVVKGIPLDQVE